MSDDHAREPSKAPKRPGSSATAPRGPDEGTTRRDALKRIGGAVAIAGVSGGFTYALYDGKRPVHEHKAKVHTIRDHRVVPAAAPQMVVVHGADPAQNIKAALARMGGMSRFVAKGETVLIKPNVGWDRSPEQAADTNPELIGALIRACRDAGAARVIVTDHPVNDPARCFKRSGITDAVQAAGGSLILPRQSRYLMVDIPGKLGRWPVLEPFVIADKIINVPIAKHHSLTRATVGMKNWYGILGGRRNRLHQRIDESVAELASLMRPTLTVIDAARLLMRNGPTGGNRSDVKVGDALALSLDPVAADAWAVTLLGVDPSSLRWLALGEKKKLGVVDFRALNPVELKV